MISDEAVEAAKVAAQHEYAKIHGRGERWDAIARAALEAAAPHLLAEAWDEGHDAAANEDPKYTNPYRSQA